MNPAAPRHFLSLRDLSAGELRALLDRARELKEAHRRREDPHLLAGRVVAMIFEKSSTRTRVSFEAGIAQLGGHALFLSSRDLQLGRGEPLEDTARVLGRMVDAVVVRTHGHERIERLARHSGVPVVNALTDLHHPCQLLADVLTYVEHRGDIAGARVAWIGDGNNVCNSFVHAAERFGFDLCVACPPGFEPPPAVLAEGGGRATVVDDPVRAARGADLLVTDVWTSMGQEEENEARRAAFRGFRIDEALLAHADRDAIVMHCLPAHRGEEISAGVLEGARSVVWDEAENRLHAQKALLELLLS